VEINTINASQLAKMFLAGADNLESKKEWINELNVFPVPDGDTGTNMTMTIMSAAREVSALENPDMKTLSKAISSGSLRGARGNSGVILSQLLRGFTKVIAGADEVDVDILCEAMQKGVETAYKAVMKPKEGTILTVARGAADKAVELVDTTDDLVYFLGEVVKEAEVVLGKTPEMLPVLKQAGVVDSGGQGLLEVLKGGYDCLLGKEVTYTRTTESASETVAKEAAEEEIRFGYCTEFIIMLDKPMSPGTEEKYKSFLSSIGDSIVVVAEDDMVKTHVHTNDPGLALQEALTYGALSRIKIDNMREEHQERLNLKASSVDAAASGEAADGADPKDVPQQPWKEMGFVAVSIGEGLHQIFMELGVDHMIEGGQTMNPSTEDVLDAINSVPAKTVFVLPNNKNIILAANQAAELCEDKEVIVLPTKTIPQGITALINFIPEQSAAENEARMTEEIAAVKTGQVTYAVRDTVIDDKEIKEGDYMGIGDAGILSVDQDIQTAFLDMIAEMTDEDASIVSIYYGQDVTKAEADEVVEKLQERFPDLEVELQAGGQPVYYYIASVE
jgi:hypothetical protein